MSIWEELGREKVEWKSLGEVCKLIRGKRLTKRELVEEGKYAVIHGGTTPMGYYDESNTKANTTIVINTGNAGEIFFIEEEFWASDACFSLYPNEILLDKYLYYWLIEKKHKIISKIRSGAMPTIDANIVEKILIPIPSLEVQEKIVEILDKFTKYVTELQAELQLRNKQYEYYRDRLTSKEYLEKLTFNFEETIKITEKEIELRKKQAEYYINKIFEELKYVPIKEVCNRQKGIKITAEKMRELDDENGEVRIFAGGQTVANISIDNIEEKSILDKPSVIVKSRGHIDFEYYDGLFSHKNEMWSYSSKNEKEFNIKFLYYILTNNKKYFVDNAISGKLPQISTTLTDDYKIPVPPIFIQNKVVEILDKFREMISETSGLLPQEIELRRKQYEYYREKLLTFSFEDATVLGNGAMGQWGNG